MTIDMDFNFVNHHIRNAVMNIKATMIKINKYVKNCDDVRECYNTIDKQLARIIYAIEEFERENNNKKG